MKTQKRSPGHHRWFGAAGIFSLLLLAGCLSPQYEDGLYAELTTNKGIIVLELEFERTPMTVANFVGLAEGTIANDAFPEGSPYYNGTTFHRVVPGHVIQAGQPVGSRTGGPGYTFPNEIHPELGHGRMGMLGMANGGPHTNGSQFYITLGDRSYLDGDYTVFGQVAEGYDVVESIVQGDVVERVEIVRIGKAAKRFRSDTGSFLKMVDEAKARLLTDTEQKRRDEERFIRETWPRAERQENGLWMQILRAGKGPPPQAGVTVKAVYSGEFLNGTAFVSTEEDGRPDVGSDAALFLFVVGRTRINPALDAALSEMSEGEKRLLVAPSELGYGTGGFYAKEREGERRFHISPNTTLVYRIEVLEIRR